MSSAVLAALVLSALLLAFSSVCHGTSQTQLRKLRNRFGIPKNWIPDGNAFFVLRGNRPVEQVRDTGDLPRLRDGLLPVRPRVHSLVGQPVLTSSTRQDTPTRCTYCDGDNTWVDNATCPSMGITEPDDNQQRCVPAQCPPPCVMSCRKEAEREKEGGTFHGEA